MKIRNVDFQFLPVVGYLSKQVVVHYGVCECYFEFPIFYVSSLFRVFEKTEAENLELN